MKRFVKKVLIYFLTVITIMTGNYFFNRVYLNKIPDLNQTKVLVVGDSRMMTAVNPDSIEGCYNAAQNSESYFISYFKIKHLLRYNTGIKRILIGFSYPSFSAYLDMIFKDDIATFDVLNRVYPIMSIPDFRDADLDKGKYYKVLFKNMLVYPHTNHHSYMGGFVGLHPGIERADLESTINRHYFDKYGNNVGISNINEAYLDSIIWLTKSKDVELVLINIPLHRDYLNSIPGNFVENYNRVKNKYVAEGIPILDYGDMILPDSYFKDYNHLDLEGANYISRIINNDLKTIF